nr:uncharacterized protein LOC128686778 [Cherax quadricarinatus]
MTLVGYKLSVPSRIFVFLHTISAYTFLYSQYHTEEFSHNYHGQHDSLKLAKTKISHLSLVTGTLNYLDAYTVDPRLTITSKCDQLFQLADTEQSGDHNITDKFHELKRTDTENEPHLFQISCRCHESQAPLEGLQQVPEMLCTEKEDF